MATTADNSVVLSVAIDYGSLDKQLLLLKNRLHSLDASAMTSSLGKQFEKRVAEAQKLADKIAYVQQQMDLLRQDAVIGAHGEYGFDDPKMSERYALLKQQLQSLNIAYSDAIMKSQTFGDAVVGSSVGSESAAASVQAVAVQTEELSVSFEDAGEEGAAAMGTVASATNKLSESIEKTRRRIAGLFRRVLFFSVITLALRSLRNEIGNILMSNDEFRESLYGLRAALWTAFSPIMATIIPALQKLVEWLTYAITAIVSFVARLAGTSYAALEKNAKKLKEQADAYKKTGSAAGKAAKQLAAFDEVQTLSSGAGGGGESALDIFGEESPETKLIDYVNGIDEQTKKLMRIAAVSLAALGLILIFTGNIGWGIGFIIAGAAMFAVTEASSNEENPWGRVKRDLEDISDYLLVGGGIAVALGILLCCFSVWGIGIGLIAAGVGAIYLGASSKSGKKDEKAISKEVESSLGDAAGVLFGIGAGLVVLGILLCIFQMWAYGIACIAGGIVAVVGAFSVGGEDNPIKKKIEKAFDDVVTFLKGWGALALGVLLCCVGLFPLGVPLIEMGAGNLTQAQEPTWTAIVDKVKEVWAAITAFWKAKIAPVFTAQWWANLGKRCINGLIDIIERGLNWIISKLNSFISRLSSVVETIGDVVGAKWSIPTISSISIPRLAQGGIVPRATLAQIGERGAEAVLPLENNTGWMDMLADRLAERMGAYVSSEQPIILELDRRELGRAVVRLGSQENRRIGTRLVIA